MLKKVHEKWIVRVGKAGRGMPLWLEVLIVAAMAGLLYYGASWQIFAHYTDAARYQCYTVAFWQGSSGLDNLRHIQCLFLTDPEQRHNLVLWSQESIVATLQHWHVPTVLVQFVSAQSSQQPWHALPYEYPALTMIPFSAGLLAPIYWYQVAFALAMIAVAIGVYWLLRRWGSREAALAYALYIVVGGWATLAGRFDIIPAGLTLGAVMCGMRNKWRWSFALLALATLFKFYPAILLPLFLLAQQRAEVERPWWSGQRWAPAGLFVLICTLVMAGSLLLSVEGTLAPLGYFGVRPVQVESSAASLLWLVSLLGIGVPHYAYTFGSLNIEHMLAQNVSTMMTLLSVVGVGYTFWLQWRRKIDLSVACLLLLLIIMVTGKVFSPQYLIWVIPLAAYIGEGPRWWLCGWSLLGVLTTCIYPYIYTMVRNIVDVPAHPLFMPAVALRNLVLCLIVIVLLISSTHSPSPLPLDKHEQV